jgi:membrane protein
MIRQSLHILLDAFYRFDRDDGWAIASHIALSILMSVFPFLIVVTAIAAFIGSVNLRTKSPAFYSRPGQTRSRARSRPKSTTC